MDWNEVEERWLPLVKEMERLGFEDYAVPELYRAAERHIENLEDAIRHANYTLFACTKDNKRLDKELQRLREYVIEEVGSEHVPQEFGGELE